MTNNFIPPQPGQIIMLQCIKCRFVFHGPNPGSGITRLFSKTRCPVCKSKKIIQFPGIHY